MTRMERGEGRLEPSGTGLAAEVAQSSQDSTAQHEILGSAGCCTTAVSDHSSVAAGFITCIIQW